MSKRQIIIVAAIAALTAAGASAFYLTRPASSQTAASPAASASASSETLLTDLRASVANSRKIIALLADDDKLPAKEREAGTRVGQAIFHDNLAVLARLDANMDKLFSTNTPSRVADLEAALNYVESGEGLFDADRLAFREFLRTAQQHVAKDGSLPAIKLHKRISEDLDAIGEIERLYDKEIRQIFSRVETRAIELKRERWEDYVARIKPLYPREQIMKDYGVILPYANAATGKEKDKEDPAEIFGYQLPPKTLVLSFDDGPHGTYTDDIAAILKQYDIPAVFFQVGQNLGTLGADGKPKLNNGANAARRLLAAGHTLANHSFSHAQLAKQRGDALKHEIGDTDTLLQAVDARRSALFRFPYGAHNEEGLATLNALKLKSVMWNIDSLDWADPVPSSIADRVLKAIDKEKRGIVLFHDIHERTVKALPKILEQLVAEGYRFATWDGSGFRVTKEAAEAKPQPVVSASTGDAWAVIIGIDEYTAWPRLQYAVRDAEAIRQSLIEKFGFSASRTFLLKNGDATRNGILALFHDKLMHGDLKKNDRVFVFFAGHGATRTLSSGRDLGYIVPVDATPQSLATDAIPMTEIQNIAESLPAKHVLFVMDACYSGLGLTRGSGSPNFLKENARRIGRQMLTAGGADQLVADGGPNGHSVFSWTLLQALAGKGDLNGDGMITATELAAYIAPAVSGISRQTPAFGSLPGSEGGEFVFELPNETEFLSADSRQLGKDAAVLNAKLDESRNKQVAEAPSAPASTATKASTPPPATLTIKDLQGKEQNITLPAAAPSSARQLAQRANDRGLQLYREQQYAAAEQAFTEALKLRPDFALAANNLGYVFYKQGKFPEAARWFENTLKMDPSRAIAYLNLGDSYLQGGDVEKAKKAYTTYQELAPNAAAKAHAEERLRKL